MRTVGLALAAALIAGGGAWPREWSWRNVRAIVSVAAGVGARWLSGGRRQRGVGRKPVLDPMVPVHIAHLTAIGLAAGLTLERALTGCIGRGPEPAGAELASVLRRASQHGLAAAISAHRGWLSPLLTVLAAAIRSGAPVEPMLRAYAREARAEVVAARVARARKLPARLSIPLALLLLPGFVLMVMGPTVLAIAERLLLPLNGR